MSQNVEVKARVRDFAALRRLVESMSETPAEAIDQVDTFFVVPRGRLKLRVLRPDACELIAYDRPDDAGARASEYFILRSSDPEALQRVLGAALPLRGTVAKRRLLYRIGRIRIHLDQVERLGAFVELEVVLGDRCSVEAGRAIAETLAAELGILDEDRVGGAYIDLLGGASR